jgi:hypothetical protein
MGTIILKAARDKDLYVAWSTNVEAPVGWGTRDEMLDDLWRDHNRAHPDCIPKPGTGPDARMDRVDATGTSARDWTFGDWSDEEFIYEQRGLLPRTELAHACDLLEAGREAEVWDLLKPFDDETPVRRD